MGNGSISDAQKYTLDTITVFSDSDSNVPLNMRWIIAANLFVALEISPLIIIEPWFAMWS